eukprot:gb/GEZN01003660.1/.p1 GENE.gb/GEZN01003660.1/~~gb/GEZN01003660.1/.p1  ORF type:complete len:675 (+),score=122.15 gb/GEZN01003660.1/:20-2044(+)
MGATLSSEPAQPSADEGKGALSEPVILPEPEAATPNVEGTADEAEVGEGSTVGGKKGEQRRIVDIEAVVPSKEEPEDEEEDVESEEGDEEEEDEDEEDEDDDTELPLCIRCNKKLGISVCSRCGLASYCSQLCQSSHWKVHRKSCGKIQVDKAQNPTQPKAECLCCFAETEDGLRCRKNFKHAICTSCFPHLVKSGCDNYMAGGLPLLCPEPECKLEIPDHVIRGLLCTEEGGGGVLVWDEYQESQLRAGLISAKTEVPVTCQKCNRYSEMLPKDYRDRAMDFRAQIFFGLDQKKGFDSDDDTIKGSKYKISKKIKAKAMRKKLENKSKRKARGKGKKGKEGEQEDVDPYKGLDTGGDELAPLAPPLLQRQQSAFTGHFFVCQMPKCESSMCLLCNKTMSTDETYGHSCDFKIPGLEEKLMDLLAEGAAQHCPKCKEPGRKDAACSHITCTCGQRWCYTCERKMEDLENGSFQIHNQFMLGVTPDKCPMYLQYKYSSVNFDPSTGHFAGDAERALALFHCYTQFANYEKFVQSLPDLSKIVLRDVIRRRFPKGLFEPALLEEMKALDEKEISYGTEKLLELIAAAEKELEDLGKVEEKSESEHWKKVEADKKVLTDTIAKHKTQLEALAQKKQRIEGREKKIAAAAATTVSIAVKQEKTSEKKKKKPRRRAAGA